MAGADTLLALALRLSQDGQPARPLLSAILALALEVNLSASCICALDSVNVMQIGEWMLHLSAVKTL